MSMDSNFEFGENQFWLLGQVITQKCMPFVPFTHVLHLLTQGSLGNCLLPRFCLLYVSHSWIGAPGSFTITIHPRWVAVCVFLPHADSHSSLSWLIISFWVMDCGWVSSPTFLWHSPPFSKLRNRCGLIFKIWGCCGFMLSRFGHDRAKNDSGIEFPSQSCVLPKLSPWFCSVVFAFLP